MPTSYELLIEELNQFQAERAHDDDDAAILKSLVTASGAHEEDLDDTHNSLREITEQVETLTKALRVADQRNATLRKAVCNLAKRTAKPPGKSAANGPLEDTSGLLEKANAAAESGRITWREYAGVDTALRSGHKIVDGLLARIDDSNGASL